jgi:hypothetical protein
MDFKSKIHNKVLQYIESSTDEAIEQFYYKINDIIQENTRDDEHFNIDIISNFFNKYSYYYNNTTNMYIEYITEFKVITENEMIHTVLNYLTNYHANYELQSNLKQQLKTKIIKKIKEKSIYNNIPESSTIQDMINFLHPNFFNNRNYAKYFMITLGDIIMKKTELFYFIPLHMKPFIKNLNKHVSMYFHTMNLCNHYKFQYYDHEPDKSRIICFNTINLDHFTIPELFYNNLICISLHYSNRYKSGDDFLNDPCCHNFKNNILWIKNTSKTHIIQTFIKEYTTQKDGTKINEKDMLFIWKDYLKNNNIMNIFQKNSEFHEYISKEISLYDGNYLNVTSMFLPHVNDFKDFWSKYMYNDDSEYSFEMNEIFQLFIEKNKDKLIDEQMINDIIKYYYPYVIVNNKVIKIGCTLWNKKKEIDSFLSNKTIIDVHELYHLYCIEFKNNKKVSKNYFLEYYSSL